MEIGTRENCRNIFDGSREPEHRWSSIHYRRINGNIYEFIVENGSILVRKRPGWDVSGDLWLFSHYIENASEYASA